MADEEAGAACFSEAMYSVLLRKGTAMWVWAREGVVADSGVFNRARSLGCKSPFKGSAYSPKSSQKMSGPGNAETTRLVALEEAGYDGEVEGHAALCVKVDGVGLLLGEGRGVFWGCVGIDGSRDAEQLGGKGRRRERVLVSYPCNVVLRHLHLRSPDWAQPGPFRFQVLEMRGFGSDWRSPTAEP